MTRIVPRMFLAWSLMTVSLASAETPRVELTTELSVLTQGFDKKMCWVHARAGHIPDTDPHGPLTVLTTQKLLLTGSDVFYALHEFHSANAGQSWQGPFRHETLGRRKEADGVIVGACDFTPKWHQATHTLLGTGHSVRYKNNRVMRVRRRETVYSVYDPEQHQWSPWQTLAMPDRPEFANAGAGCTQRVDLPDGDILLPVYFKEPDETQMSSTVVRCGFDGKSLTYKEHGSTLTVPVKRGLGEPSLTQYGGRFFLTLRNDEQGYVTAGDDGLHFPEPIAWTFDDGTPLGNYNTQQHWVTFDNGLFLAYTRKGADNDHVFRHRAPLFLAQVDPERLCVLRDTEKIIVPEKGARLGNFGVLDISPKEKWVTVTEWMQPLGVEKHGSDNRIYVVKVTRK